MSNRDKLRAELDRLLKCKSFDSVLSLLVKWTAPRRDRDWLNTLEHQELSHILKQIVMYQIGVIQDAASLKTFSHDELYNRSKLSHARTIREGLRKVYSNLLGDASSSHKHLYSRGRKHGAQNPLSAGDLENLVLLELGNGKLDLASRWFQVFEQQYPNQEYYKHMTYKLWLLKFQVYGGSKASLWPVQLSQLYEKIINPRRGNLKSEVTWVEMFNDFVKNQAVVLGSSRAVFDKSLVCEIVYSVARQGHVSQVHKLIELNFGITSDGKVARGFKLPPRSDPLYPDIEVLQTVVISLLYNRRYVESLKYINSFQTVYSLEVGDKLAKYFWDQLFRWSEMLTRYSEYRALHQYIKDTNVKALLAPSNAAELNVTLEEAKSLPAFNYEGYLQYIGDLSAQRSGLIKELWRCYHESGVEFTVRPYQTFLALAAELRSEPDCYELLRHLFKLKEMYGVSPDSYNYTMAIERVGKMTELYTNTMKLLLDIKGQSGDMRSIPHILTEWSLDPGMETSLQQWVSAQEARYAEAAKAIKEKKQQEDEPFLGLL